MDFTFAGLILIPSLLTENVSKNLRRASLNKVSKTSEVLPDPETPVTAVRPSSISTSIFFKLFS